MQHFCSYVPPTGEDTGIISLCPVLGERQALKYDGLCPDHFKTPFGKELKISFIGGGPYIKYDPIGGSDFQIVKLLAEKFRFKPKFIPEITYDQIYQNGTLHGMIHRVWQRNHLMLLL